MNFHLKHSPSTNPISCNMSDLNNHNTIDNNTSSILTTKINSVCRSPQKIIKYGKNTQNHPNKHLHQTLQWSQYSEESEYRDIYDNDNTELLDILSKGKHLRLQAESLLNPNNQESAPQGWKCGFFKRCLLGVGILAGVGVVGAAYKYYSVRNYSNIVQPETHPDITILHSEHRNSTDNLVNHQALHDFNTNNTTHSHHHVSEYKHRPINKFAHQQHSNKRILSKESSITLSPATKKANRSILNMLRGKTLPKTGKVSRAKLLYAVSAYFFRSKNGTAEHETDIQSLARTILAANKIDTDKNNKLLSSSQAKAAIRDWVFLNALGMTPIKLIEKKIKESDHPQNYTVAKIHQFLPVNRLPRGNRLHFFKLPVHEKKMLLTMWKSFLNDELPFLRFSEKSIKNLTLSHYNFANLYTGSGFLNTVLENGFSAEEAISTGEIMWDLAVHKEEDNSKLVHYCYWPPALFYQATIASSNTKHNQINNSDTLNLYLQHRKKISTIQKDIKIKYDEYIAATKKWRSKPTLNNDIISKCISISISLLGTTNQGNTLSEPNKKSEDSYKLKKNIYFSGMPILCTLSEHPDNTYKKMTAHVAYTFHEIDEYIIMAAISSLPENEKEFISSPHAIIHSAEVIMKTNRTSWLKYLTPDNHNTIFSLNRKTDLISVRIGKDERVYALKAETNSTQGYHIIRVDHDIRKHLENNTLNYNFNYKYKIDSKALFYNGEYYYYYFILKTKINSDGKNNLYSIVNFLSKKHHKTLYQNLYKTGNVSNDSFDIKNIWDVAKHMIPFYDCVEGIIDSDPMQAVPACLMDAVAFIPVFGTVASLSEKFGTGLMRGLRSGTITMSREGIGAASKNLLLEISLPTTNEMASLGKDILRTIDPGFELVTDISRTFGNRVVSRMLENTKTAKIAQKITSTHRLDTLHQMQADTHISGKILEKKSPERTIEKQQHSDRSIPINTEKKVSDDTHYLCTQNGIFNPFLSYKKENGYTRKVLTENNNADNNIYINYREKRGARKSKLCSDTPSSSKNVVPDKSKIIGSGSISTVYDLENGYVEKIYNGNVDKERISRLKSASNNAKGFNRYYGDGSAVVMVNQNIDKTLSVSVKLKKIEGYSLNDILLLDNKKIKEEIVSSIESTHPAEYLAKELQEKGIIHHDINEGNIIYNENKFFIVDFDSANFMQEGQPASSSHTESMRKKFNFVFNDFLRKIKINRK